MTITHCRQNGRKRSEAGQAMVFLVLAMGLFLLGAVAFSVDMGNLWFHRQAAQNAADAACTAGAMDLLADAQGGATGHQGFTNGTPFTCALGSTATPCKYAAFNGYNSNGTSNRVEVGFPTSASVPGLPPANIPGAAAVPTAFMNVIVTDNVQTYFAGMLGKTAQTVRGSAICGVLWAASPIPILVLDPQSPQSTPPQAALNIQGNGTIAIVGGPVKSIQVNSQAAAGSCGQSNCSANLPWGSAVVDLSLGGPNKTGSDIGLYGAPFTPPGGFIPGTTGHWIAPSAPLSDPFAQVCAPGQTGCPLINGNSPPAIPPPPSVPIDEPTCISIPCVIAYHDPGHGCPDPSGCYLYTGGSYPSDICVGNSCPAFKAKVTAVFDPGLYYVTGGVAFKSGSTVRPGTGAGDGSGGVTFYFAGSGTGAGTLVVDANSGSKKGLDAFNTTTGTGSLANGVKCTPGSVIPTNLPATFPLNPASDGANVLLGPCTGYYGDPLGASDPIGIQRGFLFFQDRSSRNVQPQWQGGGKVLSAGTMYFHSCNASGTGVGCGAPPTYYNDIFALGGNAGTGTYVLGNIVTDNLNINGTSGVTMDLNPTPSANILKASLLR